jgi:hypothetical protein
MNGKLIATFFIGFLMISLAGCEKEPVTQTASVDKASVQTTGILSDEQIRNIARRSYQYVAMYNVNNKFALKQGGWNTCVADTKLKDHTTREIARPNNDTLYISCLVDLREDPVILDMPAFDSKYVSLMITGYDHYVNIPMSTRQGNFRKPAKILLYSARTENYKGEAVQGVDRVFEATGDFVSVVWRVMPHANDRERFNRITQQMQSVKMLTLSEYQGGKAKPISDIQFPPVGKTDADIFGNNLLEVMQFVFNHTTFDTNNPLDKALLDIYAPLGVVPGHAFEAGKVASIDGARLRKAAEDIAAKVRDSLNDPAMPNKLMELFKTKGNMPLDLLIQQSVIGPIGMPAVEAVYPSIVTADGEPMNAQHDYVIRMTKNELPPAQAFWSVTLYDLKNGFFIPNERKKYSVGENAGMKLNKDGGIEIYIAAQKPKEVPDENWLPIKREDEAIGAILRIYVPEMEKMKTWQAPKAQRINN